MSSVNDIEMDIQTGRVPTTNSDVREKNSILSVNTSRESSMASSRWSTPYHEQMDTDIDCNPTNGESNLERLELSYETEQEKALRVGMAANQQETSRPLNVNNETAFTHGPYEDDVINIQLPYDTQAPTEPELWSGSFYPISLHSSIKHFTSDSKNIKVTLNFLVKYIQNK